MADIEDHESQMAAMIAKESELHELAGEFVPNVSELPDTLATLKAQAEEQSQALEEARHEQHQYEKDVIDLQEKINNAQYKLAAPIKGSDVEQLRLQIADHTVCISCFTSSSLFYI